MEILNIISEHIEIFIILMGILVLNFFCIIYLIVKERKEDKKEINELLDDLNVSEKTAEVEVKQDKELEQNKKEVEEMLMKMQKDLESKPEDAVANFENEQEEKSIISYQELLESVKNAENVKVTPVKIEEEPEKIEIDNYGFNEEPIHIDIKEPEKVEEKIELKEVIDDIESTESNDKKFKGTDFISPIFGRQENNVKYPTVPKLHSNIKEEVVKPNIIDLEATRRLDEEIKKNDDFLKALKDFRKSLD